MAKTSDITKKYRIGYWLTLVGSWVVTLVPLLYYTILGFMNGTAGQKFGLGIMLIVALILVAVNVLMKLHLRCILWVIVIGVCLCLKEIMTLLIFMGATTCLDELCLTPLNKHFKAKLTINKEIDKRG